MSDPKSSCGVFQLNPEALIELLALIENAENLSPALQSLVIELQQFRATFHSATNVYFETPLTETGRSY